MNNKFKNVTIKEDTKIIFSTEAKFGAYEILYQKWNWEGVAHAANASPRARQLKIADKICNIRDILQSPPQDWSLERRREYLAWAGKVVDGCSGYNNSATPNAPTFSQNFRSAVRKRQPRRAARTW